MLQAAVGEQKLAGPQCLEHFGGVWRQLYLSALRCRAMDWPGSPTFPITYLEQIDPQQVRMTDDVILKFYEDVVKALSALIEADAERANPAEVPSLFQQYLQVLAALVADTPDYKLQQAVQPALEKLAAKSPAFAEEVNSYQTATHELLRWRERLLSGAAAVAPSFTPSDQPFQILRKRGGFPRAVSSPATLPPTGPS